MKSFSAILRSLLASNSAPTASGWREDGNVIHVQAAAAGSLVQEQQVRVLDVRTPEEFAAGRIAEALNIDFHAPDFAQRTAQLDKTVPWLVHCQSGMRSKRALAILCRQGFSKVYHLDGGINAWRRQNLPLCR